MKLLSYSMTGGPAAVAAVNPQHAPDSRDCGGLFDATMQTLQCGDLFTQAVTATEVLTASEAMRGMRDYFAHETDTQAVLERPACQPGSAYWGDAAAL